MGLPSRRRLKKELSRKLLYYPLLRMLLFKFWFRMAFLVMVGIGLFLSVYLPKIWRTSPEDFNPVIRVSGLDLSQCWSLKRTAREAQEQGNYGRAYLSWRSAVAQNPADEEALRGFLKNFRNLKHPDQKEISTAIGQSFWLMRLTKTNSLDVELCASVYEQFRLYDIMLYAFGPFADSLPAKAEAAYIKGLFHLKRMNEFAQRMQEAEGRLNDSEMRLYKLAYQAGWSSGSAANQARAELTRLAESGNLLATRLCMAGCAQRGDHIGYQENLERLATADEALVGDHVIYWRLLATNHRKDEAVRLAERFTSSPNSAMEMLRLAETYHLLGLVEQSREVLKTFAPQFGHSPEVWSSYASVLEDMKEWNEMRAAALQIREQPNSQDTLGGYSYYLEGRAELGQERKNTAEMAFRRASESTYEVPGLGLLVARGFLKLRYLEFARPILLQIEEKVKSRMDFWETAFDVAYQLKDGEWVLRSAEQCYKLAPTDVLMVNRYAAALMVNRARPEEAVNLTRLIATAYPGSATAAINHAFALMLNKRFNEAQEELNRVVLATLDPTETSAFYLAQLELNYNLKRFNEALRLREKINVQALFPTQQRWLEETIKEMNASTTPSTAAL